MGTWKILKNDSDNDGVVVGELPGNMTEAEVAEIMRRLVSRQLTEEEVVLSSLRKGARLRRPFLDPVHGEKLQYGENPFFSAQWLE